MDMSNYLGTQKNGDVREESKKIIQKLIGFAF
jgi:hypothetical protein